MECITTKEVTDKPDMFQAIFVKVYEIGWWDMEITQTDANIKFISKEFQEGLSVRGVRLALSELDHQ